MSVDICASVISHLFADDDVRRLIGNDIYRDIAPNEGETLYIVVQRLFAEPGRHLTAVSGYTDALVQINTWGLSTRESGISRRDVEAVADAIREALDHMTGATLGTPPNEATIGVIMLTRDPDDVIPPRHGEEDVTYGARQTARIEHTESIPTFA